LYLKIVFFFHPSRIFRKELLDMSRALIALRSLQLLMPSIPLALAFVAAVDAFNTSPMHCMPLRTTRPAVSRDLRAPVFPKRATTALRMQTEEDKV
jgi:hypothetical protein